MFQQYGQKAELEMNKIMKFLFALFLITVVINLDTIYNYFGMDLTKQFDDSKIAMGEKELLGTDTKLEKDCFVSDTIYRWDDQLLEWTVSERSADFQAQFVSTKDIDPSSSQSIEIDWKVLMDIQYRLRYFSELDVEMYAPIFPKEVRALHKKEVIIKGFVIPLGEKEELLSLSYNPYASCFFCGKD